MADNAAWIETFTGRRFYVLDPRVQDVDIHDIAHALSLITRFTGHTREFYSVAEHSVRVSRACAREDALWGLLHDASEAYLSDINSPLKHQPEMALYREAEHRMMNVIAEAFGLDLREPASVKLADRRLLVTEKRDLMPPSPDWLAFAGVEPLPEKIVPWSPKLAELTFMQRFDVLTGISHPRSYDGFLPSQVAAVCQADGYAEDVYGS